MRKEVEGNELEQVVGGTIYVSKAKKMIGFEATGEKFAYTCSYMDALQLVDSMQDQYVGRSGREYEIAVRDEMKSRGWI